MRRLVILNAFPLNAFPFPMFTVNIERVNVKQIKDVMGSFDHIECYVRHPSTVKVLNDLLGLSLKPSSGLYKYEKGDELLIVTLKKPIRGKEVEVTENDLVFYHVYVKPYVDL